MRTAKSCVTGRGRNQFPSALLQPTGHLSVFKINNLRAARDQKVPSAIAIPDPKSGSVATLFPTDAVVAMNGGPRISTIRKSQLHRADRLPERGTGREPRRRRRLAVDAILEGWHFCASCRSSSKVSQVWSSRGVAIITLRRGALSPSQRSRGRWHHTKSDPASAIDDGFAIHENFVLTVAATDRFHLDSEFTTESCRHTDGM